LSVAASGKLQAAVKRGVLRELGVRQAKILPRHPETTRVGAARTSVETTFIAHLDWIDRVAAATCKKYGLRGADAEDFTAWVKFKLMADDYAVVRNIRGESELRTYLATIVVRQAHDYWRQRFGRWRGSAAAERLGSLAIHLERLVYRDGYTLEEAGEKLRTSGVTTLLDADLARLLAKLPPRTPGRPIEVGLDPEPLTADASFSADAQVTAAERSSRHRAVMAALDRALDRLDPEDQMIVRMHFGDGQTVADVARALGLGQKPLYRRVERLRASLRKYLEEERITRNDVNELLWEDWTEPEAKQVKGRDSDGRHLDEMKSAGAFLGLVEPPFHSQEQKSQSSSGATGDASSNNVTTALIRAISRLSPEEQKILGMHFEGRSFGDIAAAFRLQPKWLYRRIERMRALLQSSLEEDGAWVREVRELFWDEDAA
jgi:RNA polymerase sigma factor for flagellar operon FliA